jgi:hypothetical protein
VVCSYYKIAGVTIRVTSDLPITAATFHPKFKAFETGHPGEDMISIHHHFELPALSALSLGKELYRKPPWAIYRGTDAYTYAWIPQSAHDDADRQRMAVFSSDHTRSDFYNDEVGEYEFRTGNMESLTLFPTDQILLARILADREACFIHSAGIVLDGKGYLFVGHSSAGKSTITRMFSGRAEILCDDRNIIRRRPDGYKVYGSWSHGDIPDVSPGGAPLEAIFFLNQAKENRLVPMDNRWKITRKLLECLIRPFVTADWWEKSLNLVEAIGREVPCFELYFDRSGKIFEKVSSFKFQVSS